MKTAGKLATLTTAAVLLLASSSAVSGASHSAVQGKVTAGGTLLVGTTVDPGVDPQQDYTIFEQFWCCLERNLLELNLRPANQGGTALYPDLAVAMPKITNHGLTWTFHLKPGIHYGPPFQKTVISSKDFVTALEREANPQGSVGGYAFYYAVIKGFTAYSAGKAKTISGLITPNPTTLVIDLTQPTGDLGYRLALPAAAPIPPGAEALTTHLKDYGRFLVSTGPYMIEGSQNLNFGAPASQQHPASGYQPNSYLIMVRNPSWKKSTDPLRNAYVNKIQISIGGTVSDLANKVESGSLDLLWQVNPPAAVIQKYYTNPQLRGQLHINDSGHLEFIGMNMAQPPFNDVHVRRAVNYIIDKTALQRVFSGIPGGAILGNILAPSLGGSQEKSFDPYATPNDSGSLAKAEAEMKLSKYDPKHDGRCDVAACHNVLAITRVDSVYPALAAVEQQDLQSIGITINLRTVTFSSLYADCPNLSLHVGLCLGIYWGPDYPDAYTELNPLFGSTQIGPSGCCNVTAMGASPAQLKKAGYTTTSVPSSDAAIAKCVPLQGNTRLKCWVHVDQEIMSKYAPIVPYLNDHVIELVSSRVKNYTHDVIGYVNFDQVAISTG